VEAPGQEGDYSLTFEIASPAFGAITDLGTPSSTAILRARAIPAELVESPFAATDRAAAPSDGATAQSSLGTALAPAVAAAASLPLAALALRATLHRRRPLRLLSSGTRAAVSVLALAASALAELWS
jgi:hypothetical protein